jgi:hypothetical protein
MDMSKHSVTIHQLSCDYGNAFLNVDEKQCSGAVTVWGCCNMPTYLLQNGIDFTVMVFSDDAFAEEWLGANITKFTQCTKITPVNRLGR